MKRTGIAKLCPPSYCATPYQAFEAAVFEQDIPRNDIKGTLRFSTHSHFKA